MLCFNFGLTMRNLLPLFKFVMGTFPGGHIASLVLLMGHSREIFVWPWNENALTKQKQQMHGNRVIWLVYRTDTNARGFWLFKWTLGWKNFMPENFLEINRYFALMSYDWPIKQCLLHIRVFFGRKTKRPGFYLFIHWLIKEITNVLTETIFQGHENCSNT